MAVSFVGVGTSAEANNANITPGLPTRQAGDLLVAVVGLRSRTATASVSSGTGWTNRVSYASGWSSGANSIHIFTRQASGDSGDAVTFAPSGGASGVDIIGCIFAVRDADLSDPISAYSGAYGTSTQEDIGPTASLTVPDTGSLAVVVGSKANDSSSSPGTEIATPSGWGYIFVEDTVGGDDLLLGAFYKVTASSGETVDAGTLDVRPTSGADAWASLTFAIAPAASGITGSLARTLAAAAVASTGQIKVAAHGQPNLSPASGSAAAKVETHGLLAQSLSAGLCVAHGAVVVHGSGSCSLAASAPAITGQVAVSSQLSAPLVPTSGSGAGRVQIAGQVAALLQPATVEASTSGSSRGNLAATLAVAETAAAGRVAVVGASSEALAPSTAVTAGRVAIFGQIAASLGAAQAHALAQVGIVGQGATGLAGATLSGSGRVRITAALAVGLAPAALHASTSSTNYGQLAAKLAPGILQGSGFPLVRGTVEDHLAPAAGSGAGRVRLAAVLAVGLGATSLDSTGRARIAGEFSGQLGPATANAPATVGLEAVLDRSLTPTQVQVSALVEIHGQLAARLASTDLEGSGNVGHPPISGTLAAVLHGSVVVAVSTVTVEGAAAITLIGSQAHSLAAVAVAGRVECQLSAATVDGAGIVAWILALVYGSVCGPQERGATTGAGGPGFVQGPGNG